MAMPSVDRMATLLQDNLSFYEIAIRQQCCIYDVIDVAQSLHRFPPLPSGSIIPHQFDVFLAHQALSYAPCPFALSDVIPSEPYLHYFVRLLWHVAQSQPLSTDDWALWNSSVPYLMTIMAPLLKPSSTSAFFPLLQLPLEQCEIPREYQRDVIHEHLRKLEKQFDRRAFEPITVNRRENGPLMVVDGQHRLLLARKFGDATITAKVYAIPLTSAEEAHQHQLLGRGHRALSLYDTFRVRLAAQDPDIVHLNQLIERYGYTVMTRRGHGSKQLARGKISAIGTVEALYHKDHGLLLEQVFQLIVESWQDKGIISKMLLDGLAQFHLTYKGFYDRTSLVTRLQSEDPVILSHRAIAEAQNHYHANIAGARVLVHVYNWKRSTARKLSLDWLENGRPHSTSE